MNTNDVLDDGRLSIEVGDGVSRRTVLKQVAAASALLGTAGCLSDNRGEMGPTDEPDPATPTGTVTTATPTETPTTGPPPDFEFSRHPAVAPPGWEAEKTVSGDGLSERRAVLVLQVTDIPLYTPLITGFHDALHQLGWTGGVRGPGPDGDLGDQVDIIEDEIERMEAGDVIVTTVLDVMTYNDAIQSALDNDIAVVNSHFTPATRDWNYDVMREEIGFTYTSPVTGEDREMIVPHVGIRNERGGAAMAAEMHERLREQKPDKDEYTVFLVNDLPNNPHIARRVDKERADSGTAQRYFQAQGDVTIYQDQVFTTPQPPEVPDSRNFVVDNVQGEDVDAVVCSAFWSAVGAAAAVREGELAEDVLVCGLDMVELVRTDDSEPLSEGGGLEFAVGQDMYGQGYRSAEAAWAWLERGIPMKDLEWGVPVWDERNVEFATQRRSWEELVEWQRDNYEALQ